MEKRLLLLFGIASIPRAIRLCYRLRRFRSGRSIGGRSLLLRRVLGSALGLQLLGVKHSVTSKTAIGQGLRVVLESIRWRLGAAVNHRSGLVLLHQYELHTGADTPERACHDVTRYAQTLGPGAIAR